MERWLFALQIFKFFKKNFRLILFFSSVLLLTIYLLATTQMETKKVASKPEVPTEETITEEGNQENTQETIQEVDENEETTETIEKENNLESLKTENRTKRTSSEVKQIDDHQLLVENDKFQLFFQKKSLSIIIREKTNGALMYSTVKSPQGGNNSWNSFMKSPFVVNYITGINSGMNQLDIFTGKPEINSSETANGFSAEIYYPEQGLGFNLIVTLTESGITIEVPDESIREDNPAYTIGEMYLYPFLGYSYGGEEEGYMFIPDGSGMLIDLKDNNGQYNQPFSQPFYGIDLGVDIPKIEPTMNGVPSLNKENTISAPIFGMVHTQNKFGYLAIVENGDVNGTLEAYPNGAILPYNWITTKFRYRSLYSQATSRSAGSMMILQKERNKVDAKISYRFVVDNQADYYGLSQDYRAYLLENNLLNELESESLMRVDFFGVDSENALLSKKKIEMTTFNQMDQILQKLEENDMNNIDIGIKSWKKGGEYSSLGSANFLAEKNLGGNSELKQLLDKYKEDFHIYLYNDWLKFNPSTQNTVKTDLFVRFNKQIYKEQTFSKVFPEINYVTPSQSKNLMKKFFESSKTANYTGVALTGITNTLFSYLENGVNYDRYSAKESYEELFKEASKTNPLYLENPYQTYWKYADALLDMPISSNNYIFESQEIPFFGLALNGIVPMYAPYFNFEENRPEYLLKVLESGISPSFLLTNEDSRKLKYTSSSDIYSSKFTTFEDDIIGIYQQFEQVSKEFSGSFITKHQKIGDIVEVSYDNEKKLLLNYSENEQNFNGYVLEAYSFKVVN